jgi:hypothetical protein
MTIDHTRFTIKDRSSRHRSTKAVNKYIWGTSAKLRDVAVPIDTTLPSSVLSNDSFDFGVRTRSRTSGVFEEDPDLLTSTSFSNEIQNLSQEGHLQSQIVEEEYTEEESEGE